MQRSEPLPGQFVEFQREYLPGLPEGGAVRFGETLYLAPPDTPELQGLRVLRAGLELGTLRKGRFEPAHALAMWLDGAKNTLSLGADDPAVLRYLHGETLPCAAAGWTLVQVDGFSLGWGKSSAGTLKNHYPKGLRRV